ncbi:MAG: aminotransferase class III-fold pyridoxal phosphate-dependent enzyme, partial [Gammaproteobacteria bacterium]
MKTYRTGLLHIDEEQCSPGFTLVAPMAHESLDLVNLHGETVHRWSLPGRLGSKAYLLPNGNLLCSVSTKNGEPLPGAIPIPGALGGVILEPIQAEGGVNDADDDYLRGVRQICDERGILLVM